MSAFAMSSDRSKPSAFLAVLSLTILLGCFTADLGAAGGRAEPLAQDDGDVVKLPAFIVTAESMEFERWSKTVSPHFVIYTDHDSAEARDILLHLEKLKTALDKLVGLRTVPTRPMVFIFPSHGSDWNKVENLDRKEEWTARSVSWILDYNITQLWVVREPPLLGQLILHEDPDIGLYFAMGSYVSRSHNLPNPLWFDRGMGILAAYAKVGKDTVGFGLHNPRELQFSRRDPIPWERFFVVTYGSAEYQQTQSVLKLDAQCSLAVRCLVTSQNPPLRERLYDWLYYVGEGHAPTEAKFKELFGWDWAAWMEVLCRHYTLFNKMRGIEIGLSPAECAPPIQRTDLHAVEMRELFLLSQIVGGGAKHSTDVLDHLLKKGIKTDTLRPLLASACVREKRTEPALAMLRALVQGRCANPRVYEEAARLILERAVPHVGPDSQLDAEAGEIRALCQTALAVNPNSLAANDSLAWAIALESHPGPETIDAIRIIIERQNCMHHTREIRAALSLAAHRLGDTELARRTCLSLASEPEQDDRVAAFTRQLLAALPPAPHP